MKASEIALDLFATEESGAVRQAAPVLPNGAAYLQGFALADEHVLLEALATVVSAAGFRHMVTPGGHVMSVAMTNCGDRGWFTDRRGYRYTTHDPDSGNPWPAMPDVFRILAERAAAASGYSSFLPDACLVNRYEPGARMSLHQDHNERDMTSPIVSVSLGLPATFQFGGLARTDPVQRVRLAHGDVVVWGGAARLAYHGVLALKDGVHAAMGRARINLTFRRAG